MMAILAGLIIVAVLSLGFFRWGLLNQSASARDIFPSCTSGLRSGSTH
jgi:hypothetical protein